MSLLKTNEIQNYNGSSLTLTASTVSTSAQLNTGGNISVTGSLNVSDDSTTRTNLGLGTIATQDSDSITVTGGTATLGALTVSGSDSGDLVRITQTGTGNALVVEDSANPDSTPFVIDAAGRLLVGHDSSVDTRNYLNNSLSGPTFQQHGTTQGSSNAAIYSWVNNTFAPSELVLNKSISGTIGTHGALTVSNTDIGAIVFAGDDGTNFIPAAAILAEVDGTPGTNDMPGRLVFSTTADGASSPTERMRIDSSGNVGINRFGSTQSSSSGDGGFFWNNSSGYLVLGNNGEVACILNRWTSHGNILQFRYNGSPVGSISTNSNSLPSDRDFKKDINDLTLGLELIKKLKPKTYRYNIDEENSPFMTGFVAQDLEESLSEVGVAQNQSWILQYNENVESGNSKYELDYSKLIPILTKAIQEQQTLIESQQSQIDALTARIEALETT